MTQLAVAAPQAVEPELPVSEVAIRYPRFMHIRMGLLPDDTKQPLEILSHGGITIIYQVENDVLYASSAHCSALDNFSYSAGRAVAEARFNDAMQAASILASGDVKSDAQKRKLEKRASHLSTWDLTERDIPKDILRKWVEESNPDLDLMLIKRPKRALWVLMDHEVNQNQVLPRNLG